MKKIGFVFKHNRVWLLTASITLSLLLVISLLATQVTLFKNTLLTVFGDYRVGVSNPYTEENYHADEGIETKSDALAYANSVNEKINEEGIVLLKNENNTLPLYTPVSDARVQVKPKISVFGKNSVNLVYGGSGSGGMSASDAVTLYDSFSAAGYDVNPLLKDFYSSRASGAGRPSAPSMGTELWGFATGETPQSAYPATVTDSYKNYNAAALVVFSRIGGEGFDLPRTMKNTEGANESDHYLQLDNNERALLENVCANFETVIVVINSASSMELGFLTDGTYANVKAALWMGNPGGTGAIALGRVLNGQVNPSGRLVDTYARNFKADPTWANFGNNLSENGHTYTLDEGLTDAHFVDYEESVYVGYRYYETRYIEEPVSTRDVWYENNVVYPFGYGLSYTSFTTELLPSSHNDGAELNRGDEITVNVRVTNTGGTAGKQVVQLYYSAPYTKGGVEKPHVVLVDFGKTDVLYPLSESGGEKKNSQDLTLTLSARDMASYDCFDKNGNGFKGYELEAGDYRLSVRANAHEEIDGITLTVPQTSLSESDATQAATLGVNGFTYREDAKTKTAVVNRFDTVSNHIENYLTRADMAKTMPAAPTAADREVDAKFIASLSASAYIGSGRNVDRNKPWFTAESPTFASGVTDKKDIPQLYELRGKEYDHPLWKELLDKLTLNQAAELIGTGNFNTASIDNIMKPKTIDPDGPAGFTNFMSVGDAASVYETCFYASECVVGATFNKELAAQMGNAIGNEALVGNARGGGRPYSGWYAPAVNIHRSQFSGRNFEYYSEDGVLSGKLGAAVVQAVSKKGIYTYVKHFALNDQETQRGGICTWASEQTMRELYFKPFELIVKEGGTRAMMSSFNRIGTVWAGGSYELLTEVLRNEWGFTGMVITDYNTYDHMPVDQMIRAGGDLNLYQDKKPSVKGGVVTSSHLTAMRRAVHNILYTVANSNAMNDLGPGAKIVNRLPVWMILMVCVDVAAAAGFGVWGFFSIRRACKKQKS